MVQLVPGTCVENDYNFTIPPAAIALRELGDFSFGIQEAIATGQAARDDKLDFLFLLLQSISQSLHRPQAIAVGTNMRSQEKATMAADSFNQRRPIKRHVPSPESPLADA